MHHCSYHDSFLLWKFLFFIVTIYQLLLYCIPKNKRFFLPTISTTRTAFASLDSSVYPTRKCCMYNNLVYGSCFLGVVYSQNVVEQIYFILIFFLHSNKKIKCKKYKHKKVAITLKLVFVAKLSDPYGTFYYINPIHFFI